jgi:hypothetical protein
MSAGVSLDKRQANSLNNSESYLYYNFNDFQVTAQAHIHAYEAQIHPYPLI